MIYNMKLKKIFSPFIIMDPEWYSEPIEQVLCRVHRSKNHNALLSSEKRNVIVTVYNTKVQIKKRRSNM